LLATTGDITTHSSPHGLLTEPDEIEVAAMKDGTSTKREKTLKECKRHIDECAALLERTSVPEYREAIIAMGKAWMKIAEQANEVGN